MYDSDGECEVPMSAINAAGQLNEKDRKALEARRELDDLVHSHRTKTDILAKRIELIALILKNTPARNVEASLKNIPTLMEEYDIVGGVLKEMHKECEKFINENTIRDVLE